VAEDRRVHQLDELFREKLGASETPALDEALDLTVPPSLPARADEVID